MPLKRPIGAEPEGSKGAAPWMVTYSDSVTLLLTFFVMLMTFSTPNPEDFGLLSRGFLMGASTMGVPPAEQGKENLATEQQALLVSRLDTVGAEHPPMGQEVPLEELKSYYKDMDINQLSELAGAVQIRIPLVELFGPDGQLDDQGRRTLDEIVRMGRARPYSVTVRANAGQHVPPRERNMRSIELSVQLVQYLRAAGNGAFKEVGLSDNMELSQPALPDGYCEIVLLEV